MCKRHAPRLVNGLFAAWHADIMQVRGPTKTPVVAYQKLTAPNGAVVAVASAVKRDADNRLIHTVFRHAARHVGVVVLHFDQERLAAAHVVRRRGAATGVAG